MDNRAGVGSAARTPRVSGQWGRGPWLGAPGLGSETVSQRFPSDLCEHLKEGETEALSLGWTER